MGKIGTQIVTLVMVGKIAILGNGSIAAARSIVAKKIPSVPAKADGKIRPVYRDSKDRVSQAVVRLYRQEKFWENAADIITAKIRLPRNMVVAIQDCGKVDVVYRRQDRSIAICNELMSKTIEVLRKSGANERESAELAINLLAFIFYDRVGRMLTDELNLPVTGKEKETIDRFATYILLEWIESDPDTAMFGYKMAAATARWWEISDRFAKDLDLASFAPSLTKPRISSLLCMLYIRQPDRYAGVVDKLGLTPDRLRTCRSESLQIANAWHTLLKPHAR
jgi:hypothetical protein